MSLLSSFVTNHILSLLEQELLNHLPDAQQAILNEVKVLSDLVAQWIDKKLTEPKSNG